MPDRVILHSDLNNFYASYLPIYARKNSLRTPDLFDKIAFLTYNFSIIQTERIQGEKIFYEHTRNVRFKRL